MTREWKPGDVASVGGMHALYTDGNIGPEFHFADGSVCRAEIVPAIRPLVVIDPEDAEAVERLLKSYHAQYPMDWPGDTDATHARNLAAALREFANPTPATEPTDPRARVEDRRENIWRLLADGDWVCTSGPDIGEYIAWARLASERGPLSVEVVEP
jgi:hypothetical protein